MWWGRDRAVPHPLSFITVMAKRDGFWNLRGRQAFSSPALAVFKLAGCGGEGWDSWKCVQWVSQEDAVVWGLPWAWRDAGPPWWLKGSRLPHCFFVWQGCLSKNNCTFIQPFSSVAVV